MCGLLDYLVFSLVGYCYDDDDHELDDDIHDLKIFVA